MSPRCHDGAVKYWTLSQIELTLGQGPGDLFNGLGASLKVDTYGS